MDQLINDFSLGLFFWQLVINVANTKIPKALTRPKDTIFSIFIRDSDSSLTYRQKIPIL